MGCYDALAGLIDLNDLDLQILAYELADILNILGRQLRCGNKSADTVDGGDQTALYDFLAHGVKGLILQVLFVLHKVVPKLLALNVLTGEEHVALAIVNLNDLNFDLVANLDNIFRVDFSIRRELVAWNKPVGLITNVYAYFAVHYLHDGALDDLSVPDAYKCLFKHFLKAGLGSFSGFGNGFLDGSCCYRLYFFFFGACSHRLFQFAHSFNNLQYNPFRRRCASNNPYYIIDINIFKGYFAYFCQRFYGFAILFTYRTQFLCICTVMSANHEHVGAFPAQFRRLVLS